MQVFFFTSLFESRDQSHCFVLLLIFIYSSLLFMRAVFRSDNCFLIFMM